MTAPAVVLAGNRAIEAAGDAAVPADSGRTHDLRQRTLRGAAISALAQGTGFVLRTGSMFVMARLLFPRDFGLFGMVAAFTGFVGLFRDCGLSTASITRASITQDQLSTLFWINLAVGAALAGLCATAAPLMVAFYGEPRLLLITMVLGVGFVFNGAGAQHRAILLRDLKFGTLGVIDTITLIVGIALGTGMAAVGYGYWALVAMAITPQIFGTIGLWLATRWIPGKPRRHSGVRSMLHYGGAVTFNAVIVYVAYNVDKILLGRYWGAEALGVYGRAYQLINLPIENLNSTVSQVAYPALARIQGDPERLRSYFLQGYSLFLALVIPLTVGCALFAPDIVHVFLGPRWQDATTIFRLLAPTMLVLAVINPFAWMMLATGHSGRSLKIALMIAPTVILGYSIGLPHGPSGVAVGYSAAMLLLAVPVISWAKHGTLITARDIALKMSHPMLSIAAAAVPAVAVTRYVGQIDTVFVRLTIETGVLFAVYGAVLLFVMKQRAFYLGLLRDLKLWPARL